MCFLLTEAKKETVISSKRPIGTFEIEKYKIPFTIYRFQNTGRSRTKYKKNYLSLHHKGEKQRHQFPKRTLKSVFPKCYEYLLSEKEALLARDKGKVKFEPFCLGKIQGLTKQERKF